MQVPADLKYTKTHEWARQKGEELVVGLTSHAQEELRDVVFVELPSVGKEVKQGDSVAVVESVKAAFDIYAPISGTVTRVNEDLNKDPQRINQDCYGDGWLFALKGSSTKEENKLLCADDYKTLIEAESH